MCSIKTTAGSKYSLHSLQFSFFQRQERKSAMFHSFVAPQINPAWKRLLALFAILTKMGNRSNLYEMCPINTTVGRIYSLHSLRFSFFQRQERKSAMFHSIVVPQINPELKGLSTLCAHLELVILYWLNISQVKTVNMNNRLLLHLFVAFGSFLVVKVLVSLLK